MRTPLFLSAVFTLLTGFAALAAANEPVSAPATPTAVQVSAQHERVNLNTADALQLQEVLLGIGAVKAQAIVDHRNAHGPFASVDELIEVKGIGAATLEKNRERITLN
jgi:competence protein ComEA